MKKGPLLRTTIVFFLVMTVLTGFVYPFFITGVAQLVFPFQANGSLIQAPDGTRGSFLIAQEFTGDGFFHARPSSASFATVPSGASNLSPAGNALKSAVEKRDREWRQRYGTDNVPADMLYASASGLDPEISPEAALAQVNLISGARKLTDSQKSTLLEMVNRFADSKIAFPSPARVNIMELNRELEYNPQFGQTITP
jgi:potassium-transporting ATPase KdpC subunit